MAGRKVAWGFLCSSRWVSCSFPSGESAYVTDNWNFNTSNPCLHAGGNYNQNQNHGMFHLNYNGTSNKNANIGGRTLACLS